MDSWHSRPQADLFQELDARPGGLTRRQAEERLARYGPNQLEPPRRPGLLSRVMAQMKDPMILVLLGAAGLSLDARNKQFPHRIPIHLVHGVAAGLPAVEVAYHADGHSVPCPYAEVLFRLGLMKIKLRRHFLQL